MNAYETSTTVGGQGDIHLAGVPFQPGTEVEIIICPKTVSASPPSTADERILALMAALDHAHNVEPIGSLRRDDLYDRDNVR
jgi:hypothetical protein